MPSLHVPTNANLRRVSLRVVAGSLFLAIVSSSSRAQSNYDTRPAARPAPRTTTIPVARLSERARQNPTQNPTSVPDAAAPSGGGGGATGEIVAGLVGTALAGAITYWILKSANNRSHNGPDIKPELDMNDFTIDGLAGANWPVGFDFSAGSPGLVRIEVTSDGGHGASFERRVAPGRRESLRFFLPPDFNAKVQDARYHVLFVADAGQASTAPGLRAFGLAAGVCGVTVDGRDTGEIGPLCPALTSYVDPQRMPGNQAWGRPSLLRVGWAGGRTSWAEPSYGGSIQLDQITFGPGIVHPKLKEVADYGFRARHAFNDARPDFMLTTLENGHTVLRKDREDQPFPIGEGEVAQKTWDPTKSKPGDHMLQVKAWRGLEAGGDWAIVWSQDVVTVAK